MADHGNWLDRAILAVAPHAGLRRIRARLGAETLRHYEAASRGRRTLGWNRSSTDANAAAGAALGPLRYTARDLVRNNAWARNALRVISTNTVGWGIVPKPVGGDKTAAALWKPWAESTQCDADGRLTFYGLERLVMRTVVEAGECIVRRRWRRPEDGLAIPMQLQVLEPDILDTNKDGQGQQGGPIVQGVEFDAIGRRVAYWMFDKHPGSLQAVDPISKRVSADNVLHIFDQERPGQARGASWLAAAILTLSDLDEYENALLVKQKIAACFAGFVVDTDGTGAPLGAQDASNPGIETIEPGLIQRLSPGQDIRFGNPPAAGDEGFSTRTLRKIAAALGVTYEDLTGDYSLVNYSSGRMGWMKHWSAVEDWRWNMLIPQFCDPAWSWAMEVARLSNLIPVSPAAEWTPPPKPMLDPEKEGIAYMRRVRSGAMTPSEMVREQGKDPDAHFAEYAADMKKLDALGIVLDSDPRRVTQSGQAQQPPKEDAPPQEDNPTPAE